MPFFALWRPVVAVGRPCPDCVLAWATCWRKSKAKGVLAHEPSVRKELDTT
jgi:hypothetical protein